MDPLIRAYEAVVDDVSSNERAVTAIVNTGSVDRFRSVIEPAGIDLEAYRRSPVLLWEHGKCPTRGRLPIGRALWIKRQGNKLVLRGQFGKDDYSMALWEMYRDGLCRGWSIFAIPDPKQMSPPTRSEIAGRPEMGECDVVYRKCELGEVSCVSVPGNSDTLTILAERGIWYPTERAGMQPTPPPAPSSVTTSEADAEDDDDEDIEESEADGPPRKKKRRKKKAIAGEAIEECAAAGRRSLPPLEGVRFADIYAEMMRALRANHADQRRRIEEIADLLKGRV